MKKCTKIVKKFAPTLLLEIQEKVRSSEPDATRKSRRETVEDMCEMLVRQWKLDSKKVRGAI